MHSLASILIHRLFSIATSVILFLLSLGPIPQHVAFVMDGNRRYARELGQQVESGHTEGFNALRRTLEICLRLRIRAVSIYAFAIDNFSRSEKEVGALMNLAKQRLTELCQHGDLLEEYGVKIRFIGQLDLLPPDVLQAVRDMEAMTQGNKNDITAKDVFDSLGVSKAINTVDKSLFVNPEEPEKLDILVRTSDVKRLSDFMMWQACDDTQLHFVKTYWPEFGLSDMLPILLGWQQKVWMRELGWC
ncbi:di-trans,poly-cis-decaprenylcistransferase [Cryptococcus gattii Ru294]|nr:di-trans,poly-cis-decaprenylcistransferase [Cryptococcus gattii Ru294]